MISRRGLMLVLSSPSGAGKTTIARRLLDLEETLSISISVTTRSRRPGEVNGEDYLFIEPADFRERAERGDLLEHAKVFGNYYGTPREPVERALCEGRDVLFDIDWQGTQQLQARAPGDLVSVFILPPSTRELERRLRLRAQDPDDVVAARMAKAADEISHYPEYQYLILNEDFDASVDNVRAILRAERLKRERQIGLPAFVKRLQEGTGD